MLNDERTTATNETRDVPVGETAFCYICPLIGRLDELIAYTHLVYYNNISLCVVY